MAEPSKRFVVENVVLAVQRYEIDRPGVMNVIVRSGETILDQAQLTVGVIHQILCYHFS